MTILSPAPGPDALPERIRAWLDVEPSGCWIWRRSRNPKGYGWVRWAGRMRLVHRVVWSLLVGPLPPYDPRGPQLDHRCDNTACANPAHLVWSTPRANTLRSTRTVAGRNAAKTSCPAGHAYVQRERRRDCLDCVRDRRRARRVAVAA